MPLIVPTQRAWSLAPTRDSGKFPGNSRSMFVTRQYSPMQVDATTSLVRKTRGSRVATAWPGAMTSAGAFQRFFWLGNKRPDGPLYCLSRLHLQDRSMKYVTFEADFKELPRKGKHLVGVAVEIIDGEKWPKLLFEDARLETMESPRMDEFAGVMKAVYHDKDRPEFTFRQIANHPFAGRQYCHYSPQSMRGTALGKAMIEADIWMKLVASNAKPTGKGFVLWNRNTNMPDGLKSELDFETVCDSGPFYLVCKRVFVNSNENRLLFPKDPEMAIEIAPSPQFGEYLTSVYDDIVRDGAPALERIREIPKMIVVAEWLKEQGIKIDKNWIRSNTQPNDSCIPQTYQKLKSRVDQNLPVKAVTDLDKVKEEVRCTLGRQANTGRHDVIPTPFGPIRRKIDYEIETFEIDTSRFSLKVVESHYLSCVEKPVFKDRCTIRGSANDDDLDWVYEAVNPRMPINGILSPQVKTWSELYEQSINPFCHAALLCSDEDSGQVYSRCSWGGCSMKNFQREEVPTRSAPQPSYSSYKNPSSPANGIRPGAAAAAAAMKATAFVPLSGQANLPAPVSSSKAAGLFEAPEGMRDERVGVRNPLTGAGSLHDSASKATHRQTMRVSAHRHTIQGRGKGNQVVACKSFPFMAVSDAGTESVAGNECPICLKSLTSAKMPVAVLECDHQYHEECISAWFEKGESTCPKCRRAVTIR